MAGPIMLLLASFANIVAVIWYVAAILQLRAKSRRLHEGHGSSGVALTAAELLAAARLATSLEDFQRRVLEAAQLGPWGKRA